jgi:3'-phosphoadenosine 5'-phosphosulfate sulfotransferase (PAPS reductase)/FAD synthetase
MVSFHHGGFLKHIVSYGGGVNSTAMVLWQIGKTPIDQIIFCDTGAELPETLEYVNTFGAYLKGAGLQIETVGRAVGLYEYCWEKHLIPTRAFRWCTDKFKIRPFDKIKRQYEQPVVYIGYDAGEDSRVVNAIAKCDKKSIKKFPLYFAGIDRDGCKQIIESAGLPEPPKSGCYICPFQSYASWVRMKKEQPNLFQRAVDLENRAIAKRTNYRFLPIPLQEMQDQQDMVFSGYEIAQPCGCHDGS